MSLTISELLDVYRLDRLGIVACMGRVDSTIRPLARLLGHLAVATAKRSDFLYYSATRTSEGVVPSTVRREMVTLRAALNMARREDIVDRVPSLPIPCPGPPRQRVLAHHELRTLQRAVEADQRVVVFLALLIGTAARREAIAELTWDRVDFDRGQIDLRAPHPLAMRRKRRAVVPMAPHLAKLLEWHRDNPYVSRGRGGYRRQPPDRVIGLSANMLSTHLRNMAAAARLDGVSPHVLRHTVATHLLRHVSLFVASRMLGHSSVAITEQVYAHMQVDDLNPAAMALDALL